MLVTKLKPEAEIAAFLPRRVMVIYCRGCSEVHFPYKSAQKTVSELRARGIEVVGELTTDYLCNPDFVRQRLEAHKDALEQSEAALVFSCGVGVQETADQAGKPVYTGCDTIRIGGYQGLKPRRLDCLRCGECVLTFTGGICPVANCAKSLVNGPCGGASKGKCEIDPEKDCAWMLIYRRLRDQGRLELMSRFIGRDYSKLTAVAQKEKSGKSK